MRLAPLLALPPIALGLAAAAWMVSTAPGPAQVTDAAPAVAVRVVTVMAQDIRPTATVWGNLRAADRWIAVAQVQGEVIWRHPDLEPGRLIVAQTDVLRIDPTEYELALAQARADLAALTAEAAQLTAEAANTARILALEQARLTLAEADLTRIRALTAQGTTPQTRADEAERATLLARRTVAEFENGLALVPSRQARITAQTARTTAAIDRAQQALSRTTLTTPYDVRIAEVSAELYQTVAPGQAIIRGDGLASVEVVAHLPLETFRRLVGDLPAGTSAMDRLRDGPTAQMSVIVSPLSDPSQLWTGQVARIEGALDARARTVPVVVTIDNPYLDAAPPGRMPLVPNMQVQVTFTGMALPGKFMIPASALHGTTVRIANDQDRLELRLVTPAFVQDGQVIVSDGLVSGDRVVLDDIVPALPDLPLAPVEASQ